MSESIERVLKAVEKAAECPAAHVETVAVVEGLRDQIVWQGQVEVFELTGYPSAKRAYGWECGEEVITVLEIPPVHSANTAVRAALIASRK